MRRVTGFLVVGLALLAGACASTGATPRPFPVPPVPKDAGRSAVPTVSPEQPSSALDIPSVVGAALELRGAPYRNGGTDPTGFDCSGFTQYVFGRVGLDLPREVHEQFRIGHRVRKGELAPGDLVFFSTTARGASHVAIVIDRDHFVHAPSSRGVVRVERLSADYWRSRFVGIRRVTPNQRHGR